MQPLIWEHRPDSLRAPALVCAFTGWNDAGDAASSALSFLGASLGATRFAQIDPEEFYDFQSVRPKVKLVDGETREIVWPSVEVFAARVPRAPRDLVLLGGPEPSMHWRGFTALITDLAEALGVQLVVTLGALLADVPHSLPVHISGSASDQALTERLGLHGTGYEGPTGIVGVLHATCAARGIPSASLWASVPHYVAAAPNPKAALALVRKLEGLVGVAVDASELETAAADYERQVGLAVQRTPTSRPSSSASSRWRPTSTPTRPRRSPPATASPASSSGSSNSAARTIRSSERRMRRSGDGACAVPREGACTLPHSPLLFDRRAGDPVLAHRADRERRRRLEGLRHDRVRDLVDGLLDPPWRAVGGAQADALVVEHVVVGALGRLDLPGLAGRDRVERELDVVAQLLGAPGDAGLVVDQLVAAAGQLVDTVDAATDQVAPEREGERALEPARLAAALVQALLVAGERDARLLAQLALLVGVGEAAAPPGDVQQRASSPRCRRRAVAWKRSSTWCTRMPKRWLSVGSRGIRSTRANL